MAPRDTAIQLLQLIALMLPAVAIYLDTVYPEYHPLHPEKGMDDAEVANFHAIRLTFLLLIVSATALLLEMLFTPRGLETVLVGGGIVFLGAAVITFALPIAFNSHGIEDERSILWPYKNTWHRFSGQFGDSPKPPDDEK